MTNVGSVHFYFGNVILKCELVYCKFNIYNIYFTCFSVSSFIRNNTNRITINQINYIFFYLWCLSVSIGV